MKTKPIIQTTSAVLLAMLVVAGSALAQGTAFTYQGRLDHAGNPAHGSYDLNFDLHDVPSGGSSIGPVVSRPATPVINGLFTVTLDFGNQFPGADRWLEIAVRTNGGGAFSPLVPRQLLTATPYAIRSGSAGAVNAANISGILGVGQLPGVVVTNGGVISGTFLGNAAGLSNVPSASLMGPMRVDGDPVAVGHTPEARSAEDVDVSGGYVYLAGWPGLYIYQISNPATPVLVGTNFPAIEALGVVVSEDHAFVAAGSLGLRIFNVSNPAEPVEVAQVFTGGHSQGLAVSGQYLYLANGGDGLRVYNIANPAAPQPLGHVNHGGFASAYDAAVSGSHLYLANGGDGLRVYDLAKPDVPVPVGHGGSGQIAQGVAVFGGYAYLARGISGLSVYNVANPAAPMLVMQTNHAGIAVDVSISSGLLYLASASEGVHIYSLVNPAAPEHLGRVHVGDRALGVSAQGGYAYVANRTDGLRVYSSGVVRAPSFAADGAISAGGDLRGRHLELGVGIPNRTPNTGRIAFQEYSDGLDIIGASRSFEERKLTVHAEGGSTFTGGAAFSGPVTATSVSGNGSGLTDLSASAMNSGTIPDGRVGPNVAMLNRASQNFAGNNTFAGRVGIGTITPLAQLGFGNVLGDKISFWENGTSRYGMGVQGNLLQFYSDYSESDIAFGYGSSTDLTEVMRIKGNGRVGIGTTDPDRPLAICGAGLNSEWLSLKDSNGVTRWHFNSVAGGLNIARSGVANHVLFLGTNGLIGINKANPATSLDVNGDIRANGIVANGGAVGYLAADTEFNAHGNAYLRGVTATFRRDAPLGAPATGELGGDGSRIVLYPGTAAAHPFAIGINGATLWTGVAAGSSHVWYVGANEVMRLSPQGRMSANEVEIRGGADIAEPFHVAATPESPSPLPGMVMAIHPDNPGELRVCTGAYDRTVAGILSGAGGVKPGLTLRQEDTAADGKHPLALSGRVYCWVDADANGAVSPGDLLTSSDTAGHAMRATDPARSHGAVLGKAMTKLAQGRGLVLVLVNLQ